MSSGQSQPDSGPRLSHSARAHASDVVGSNPAGCFFLLFCFYFFLLFLHSISSYFPSLVEWPLSGPSRRCISNCVLRKKWKNLFSSPSTPSSVGSGSRTEDEEKVIGLSVLVSFNGADEFTDLSSLSGGQKSIVALAFIFAIQKCDPAPFYIFDEVCTFLLS